MIPVTINSLAPVTPNTGMSDSPLRAIVIDDNSFDRRRLIHECGKCGVSMQIEQVSSLSQLAEALTVRTFDLIFIDYRLNDGDGLMALEMIYSNPRHLSCATIMIAGDADAKVAVEALKNGCSDYIEKAAITPASIQRAVINAVQKSNMKRDISTAQGMNDALHRVLDRFAQDCIMDMKPVLSRMLRQIRADKSGHEASKELEQSCTKLWGFLEAIENYSAQPEVAALDDAEDQSKE